MSLPAEKDAATTPPAEKPSKLFGASMRRYVLVYTCLFLVTCIVAFIWYFATERTFIWQADGWTQHYKALVYYGQYLRAIVRDLLAGNGLVIPAWDFSIGEGSDILVTLHYYVIGDPLNLLAVFVPTKYMWMLYDFLILLRLYLAGLFFSLLCFETKIENRYGVLAGALTYAFCAWALVNVARHPFFLNPLVYFPLLILGIERILAGKRPWVFVAAVFVSTISNFYFLYMLTLLTLLYVVLRLVLLYRKNPRQGLRTFLAIALYAILGVALGAVILLPILSAVLGGDRLTVDNGTRLHYTYRYYTQLFAMLITSSTTSSYWLCLGYSVVTLPALFLFFYKRHENSLIKVFFLIGIVIICLPILGQALNGFSYITNRWSWAFALLCAYILAKMWPSLMALTFKEARFLVCMTAGYLAICLLLEYSHTEAAFVSMALVALLLTLLLPTGKEGASLFSSRYQQLAVIAVVIVSICVNSYYKNSNEEEGQAVDSLKIEAVSELYENETVAIEEVAEAEGVTAFYRYSGRSLTSNASLLTDLSSTRVFWSLTSSSKPLYLSLLAINDGAVSYNNKGYDDRTVLLALASVKYYVIPASDTAPVPYGYTYVTTSTVNDTSYAVYVNDYALPLAYTYDASISEEEWESLNAVERQEAMLSAVVVDDDAADTDLSSLELLSESLDYTITCNSDQVTQDGNSFVVTSANASITLTFEGLTESETYVVISGLTYEGSSNSLSIKVKSSTGVSKTLTYQTPYSGSYSGQHDFAVNLDYADEAVTTITITFPSVGTYSFDSIEVVCEPMENYVEQASALAEDTLDDLVIGTNTVSGTISLDEDDPGGRARPARILPLENGAGPRRGPRTWREGWRPSRRRWSLQLDEMQAEETAVGQRHADGVAGDRGGIHGRVTAAQAVAGAVQAGDRVAVGVEDVEVVVGHEAAEGHEADAGEAAVVADAAEVRRLVDGDHAVGVLAVVGVDAGVAQLVVALDGGDEGVDGVALIAQIAGQLFEGVGAVHRVGVGAGHGDGVLAGVLGGGGHGGLEGLDPRLTRVVRAAVMDAGAGDGLLVLHVGDAGDDANRLAGGRAAGGVVVGLVHEALAVGIQLEHAGSAEGTGHGRAGGHDGTRRRVDETAGPAHHLVAAAVTAGHAGDAREGFLEAQAVDAHLPLDGLGEQRRAHGRVVGEVARGDGDALGGVQAHIAAVGCLGDDAGHGAVVVLLEHIARVAPIVLGAKGDGVVHSRADDGKTSVLHAAGVLFLGHLEAQGAGPRAMAALDDRVVRVVHRAVFVHVDVNVERAVVDDMGVGLVLGDDGHEVVDHLAGVLDVLLDEGGVDLALHALQELVDDRARVGLGDAPAVHDELRVEVADLGAVAVEGLVFLSLDDGDGDAGLGAGQSDLGARIAAAHDDDLVVGGRGDLVLGDDRGLAQPVDGRIVAGGGVERGLLGLLFLLGFGFLFGRGLVGQGHAGAHRGKTGSANSGALEEASTRGLDFLHNNLLGFHLRIPLALLASCFDSRRKRPRGKPLENCGGHRDFKQGAAFSTYRRPAKNEGF